RETLMFESLRDRKGGKQEDAAGEADEKAGAASGDMDDGDTKVLTPRSSMIAQRSKPSVMEQINRVNQQAGDIADIGRTKSEAPKVSNQKLTIGPGVHIEGQISNCDTLVVEGEIEVSAVARSIEISEQGTFIGDAKIDTADISGRFEGDLTVADRLIVRSTGRVSGKILYTSIQIESGGRISGDIQVSEAPEPAQSAEPSEPTEASEPTQSSEPSESAETKEDKSTTSSNAPKSAAGGGR
nr:polymer-forming cytoskeletal protein [Desulfuromonadales bacterium]